MCPLNKQKISIRWKVSAIVIEKFKKKKNETAPLTMYSPSVNRTTSAIVHKF